MRYWLLQAIVDIINQSYSQVFSTSEAKNTIHDVYFKVLQQYPQAVMGKKHYASKYALIFIMLVREDFPERWGDAFTQLLQLLSGT